ncbi:hypothetical protein HPP92_012857 [Vanilla planifolia]|uniref:Pseudouridine synthase RsuA/RluA-like domain-containing protein n=1 Tax=Vanilla planifolia TaxID=51239 RepID=A0A835QUJ9_VANPL|nr:hypothetical protein HPP92_012857 [Vanilla planifolia]
MSNFPESFEEALNRSNPRVHILSDVGNGGVPNGIAWVVSMRLMNLDVSNRFFTDKWSPTLPIIDLPVLTTPMVCSIRIKLLESIWSNNGCLYRKCLKVVAISDSCGVWAWKLSLQLLVMAFTWWLCHNVLPNHASLALHGLGDGQGCPWGYTSIEIVEYVADLIQFGAIHYALVCPKPPPSATPQEFQIYKEFTEPSVLQKRSSLKGKTVREAQKTYRVTDVDEFVEAGTYLRVHVHPKRYSRCYQVDWKSRIIANTDTYVVLDKPAATSVGGSMDNIEETCATFASRALGLESPLRTTHQLDNCTEGCLVLSKTKEFCSIFHGMIREKQVRKLYLALAAAPVPTGIISHYMRPVNLAPRLVSEDFIEGWHLCQMEILECGEVPWPDADVIKAYNIDECGWPFKKTAYECKINLLTGKTHQVRAQLAAIGAPIVGDSMYMPAALASVSCPLINPFAKQRKEYSSDGDKVAAMEEWLACHGKEPNSAIGLQASEISWNEGSCSYHAGIPWWRQPAT